MVDRDCSTTANSTTGWLTSYFRGGRSRQISVASSTPGHGRSPALLINVPPKLAVSSVVGYIKGKSAIHVARHFLRRERNYAGQRIWARGFFVDTVGRDTETIRKYIAEQEMEDRRLDQLEMPEITRE
jgi:hypothetical protein